MFPIDRKMSILPLKNKMVKIVTFNDFGKRDLKPSPHSLSDMIT